MCLGAAIPFSLEQLSNMGKTLCEVTLGVINIMNHEIRTTTVSNYDLRSKARFGETFSENEMYSKDKWNEVLEVKMKSLFLLVKIFNIIKNSIS